MKKIFVLAIVAAGLLSCTNSTKTTDQNPTDQTQAVDTHTAQNSLDYKGTYKGTIPCADCEGIEVELKIGDKDYTRTMVYKGKKEETKFEDKGAYTWDAAGSIIILDGVKDAPDRYFVGENFVKQLDMDGKEITGEHAAMYILRK